MTCGYEKFFIEVFHLKDSSDAPTKQHEIYFNEINNITKTISILEPSQAIECLSKNKKITQSYLNLMEKELELFSVTYPSGELNIGYPAFQFDYHANIIKPEIGRILKSLNGMYKNWDLAFWFNSFSHDLGGSILEVLHSTSLESLLREVNREKNCQLYG